MRTSKERKELHIKLFTMMAEQGWNKPTCLTEMEIPKDEWPVFNCFACEEVGQEEGFLKENCANCPIKWPGAFCESVESPYYEARSIMGSRMSLPCYVSRSSLKEAAKKILKLPFRLAWAEENRMETTFKNCSTMNEEKKVMLQGYPINVGDMVWHRDLEWREVISIEQNHKDNKPIRTNGSLRYMEDGRRCKDDPLPEIFWQPVEIIPPPKPKKKVKRQLVVDGVVWAEENYNIFPIADSMNCKWNSLLNKPPMKMTLEWEEEE